MPSLELELTEPVSGGKKRFIAPIDTGFAGYLLVPKLMYTDLATMELPQEDFGSYSTMAGPIILRRATVEIKIGKDRRLSSFIETPMHGEGKLLAGRRIISQLKLALLGDRMMCCQLKPVQT
jgi:predicted aspartyl protease